MKTFLKQFCICGIIGWCLEILFTSLHSLQRHNYTLFGRTSIWMFPIYGMAVFVRPASRLLKKRSILFRGITYALGIFTVEFITGNFLMRRNCCPWDYESSRWNYKNIIRLDYFPFWIFAGLLYEKLLSHLKNPQ